MTVNMSHGSARTPMEATSVSVMKGYIGLTMCAKVRACS